MARKEIQNIHDTLQQALDLMKQNGADYAAATFSTHQETEVKVRNGVVESLETSKPISLDLYMRVGDKSESIELNSRSVNDLNDSVAQLAAAVRRMPDNVFDRPVDPSQVSHVKTNRTLDLIDRTRVSLASMIQDARAMEAAALAVPGVSISKGGAAGWYKALTVSLDSRGDEFIRERTGSSRGVSVIARSADDQRTGGEGSSAVYYDDLMSPDEIGRVAGIEAVQALNPGKALAGHFPVVFHPDIGPSLLGHFASAISGGAVRKKTSFLTEAMNRAVFAPEINIIDNPHLLRGLGSTRFSGSRATQPMTVVEKGVLKTWFMGLEDARRLGLENARQIRGPSNLTIEPGVLSQAELIARY
jgi:PmbA protein